MLLWTIGHLNRTAVLIHGTLGNFVLWERHQVQPIHRAALLSSAKDGLHFRCVLKVKYELSRTKNPRRLCMYFDLVAGDQS